MRTTVAHGQKPKADRLGRPAVLQHPGHDHPHYRVMTKHKPMPPLEVLEEWFTFDRTQGKLYWRKKPARQIVKNTEAGWVQKHGSSHLRWSVNVPEYGRFLRSRVVWKLVTGSDPHSAVDHANGNSMDDRFENLIDGGKSWNNRNRQVSAQSGLPGAYPTKNKKRWMATIQKKGKTVYLGTWDTAEEASQAYLHARSVFEQEARAHGA